MHTNIYFDSLSFHIGDEKTELLKDLIDADKLSEITKFYNNKETIEIKTEFLKSYKAAVILSMVKFIIDKTFCEIEQKVDIEIAKAHSIEIATFYAFSGSETVLKDFPINK